ncbi:MAG TPA: ferrous iron transporter B [Bryobacteraceae bacterium]|nr:ferrous iron transporter B [Bryobacteraceae bacterium]
MSDCHGCSVATLPPPRAVDTRRHIVAIVGPPNSGKSTLFNRLTGLRQKVANFPGVTVEHRMGKVKVASGREVFAVDLPGVYGLEPRTEDERVTHDVLLGQMKDLPKPDAVLLILDSTNLARHLVLAAPVLSLGLPTLVILNMADDLKNRGGGVDVAELSMQLGSPVALVSASRGDGFDKVFQFLAGTTQSAPQAPPLMQLPVIQDIPKCRAWAANVGTKGKYQAPAPPHWTRRLDAVFLHPVAGPLIFVMVVVAVFQAMFSWATPLMDGVQYLVDVAGMWTGSMIANATLRSLIVDGIFKGVGSVVVFLPQILFLFLFIGILEDSGYLARAALIADRTMSRFGLQGKSFIPLLSAYACAVPAIMATRTIENKRDRIATILIAPFMTCSARLPVYTLVIAAFIPDRNILGPFLGARAATMIGLYILGFLAAIFTARLLKSTVLKSTRSSFMLEMPPYRWPTARSLALRLIDRSKVFLRRAGTVILLVAVVLWVLAYLPLTNGQPSQIDHSFAAWIGHAVEPAIKPLGFNWKIGIGLITSLAAREVIVGTLGTIYGIDGTSNELGLQAALQSDLTMGGALALLVFFAFAMQCMSTLAVVRRETGGWRWPIIQFSYMTAMAYVCAFLVNKAVTGF